MEKANAAGTRVQLLTTLLRITCFCIFAGRAWQHLMWDAPFRALLWDQAWMQGVIEGMTSMAWEEYVSSLVADHYIQLSIRITGWLYAACAVLSFLISSRMKWAKYVIFTGIASLSFLAFLNYKERFFQAGELMEHGIQLFAPVLLMMVLFSKLSAKGLAIIAKAAVAFTFIGHGLYAWGYYPQPGPYIDMLINILHFDEEFVNSFLKAAAILDFAVAILIFIPVASRAALVYCAVWGSLTALARIIAGFDSNFIAESLNQYLFETLFRLSHGLLPLWIFLAERGKIASQVNTKQVKPYAIRS